MDFPYRTGRLEQVLRMEWNNVGSVSRAPAFSVWWWREQALIPKFKGMIGKRIAEDQTQVT